MSNENLSTFRKFVMEYGSILGLCWTAVFACYIIGFRTQSGLSMLLGICGLIALLPLESRQTLREIVRVVPSSSAYPSPFYSV